jgi:hypothetical protein
MKIAMGLACACACGTPGLLFSCQLISIAMCIFKVGLLIVDVSGWTAVLMATST